MVEDFFGQYIVKIDDKKRIFLPAVSKVEKDEQFMVINSTLDKEAVLRLYSKVQYFEIVKKYEEFRKNAKTDEEYLRLTQKIDEICLSIEKVCRVDAGKRIVLPSSSIKHCDLEDCANVIGMGNSFLIRKPKNAR